MIEAQGRIRLLRSVSFLPVIATLVAMATAWEMLLQTWACITPTATMTGGHLYKLLPPTLR